MHFGWRARDEHRKVLLGDLEIRQEEGGELREYIIWKTERGSKKRTGGKNLVQIGILAHASTQQEEIDVP